MALVDYASSSDESESEPKPDADLPPIPKPSESPLPAGVKRKRESLENDSAQATAPKRSAPPPLPDSFHDLYATAARVSTHDDPSLHGGRKRTTPHIPGNWPTHIYLEWHPSATELSTLTDLVTNAQASLHSSPSKLHSLVVSDLGVPQPLHISLSASLGLATPQRESFLAAVRAELLSSNVRPFAVTFDALRWAPNHARNRWFLVLRVARPTQDELNRLLRACNAACGQFDQPLLYTPRRRERETGAAEQEEQDATDKFHFSIAWTLEPPADADDGGGLQASLESGDGGSGGGDSGGGGGGGGVGETGKSGDALRKALGMEVHLSAVKLKIGNAVTALKLGDAASLLTSSHGKERGGVFK